jgi:FKBP-type peptidyl-prolyl cis-trans isomerase SlyD
MRISSGTVVSVDIELADLWGNVIQRSDEPLRYLHGGYDEILPALERAFEGKQPADKLTVRLEPEDAFGEYDESLLRVEPQDRFPAELAAGMRFEGIPGEAQDGIIYIVTDIAENKVVLDGNHPLAGIALEFRCTIREVRAATTQELAQGVADDPGELSLRIV